MWMVLCKGLLSHPCSRNKFQIHCNLEQDKGKLNKEKDATYIGSFNIFFLHRYIPYLENNKPVASTNNEVLWEVFFQHATQVFDYD